jgi:PAS domain-containing protein
MTRNRAKKDRLTRICEKDYLKNLVALCPDGIIAVNRFGTVTLFNRAAEEFIGHRASDVVGKAKRSSSGRILPCTMPSARAATRSLLHKM